MIRLKSCVNFYVSNFYSSHCKYAMPFQQKHSFYRYRNFMSNCGRHRLARCHCQLSRERAHLFLLKSNGGRFRHVSACAWGFNPASGLNFPSSLSTIVPCNIFELRSTSRDLQSSSSLIRRWHSALKTSKSASMGSPSFFMSQTK